MKVLKQIWKFLRTLIRILTGVEAAVNCKGCKCPDEKSGTERGKPHTPGHDQPADSWQRRKHTEKKTTNHFNTHNTTGAI